MTALTGSVTLAAHALTIRPQARESEAISAAPDPNRADSIASAMPSEVERSDSVQPHVPEPPLPGPPSSERAVAGPASASSVADDSPVTPPEPAAPVTASTLDFVALSDLLTSSSDPIDDLRRFVGDIRTRETASQTNPLEMPGGLERYAARLLEESGLFASDVELPVIEVVRPQASRMVYLRCTDQRIPYLAKLRILKIEAALNALRFATSSLDAHASMEDAYRLNQRLARSIVAQAAPIDEPIVPAFHAAADGEWSVRYGISQAIESLQLPYRLCADYRCNVADGNVAIEFDLTPADVFFGSCWLEGTGIVQDVTGNRDDLRFTITNSSGNAIQASYRYEVLPWDAAELANLTALDKNYGSYESCPNLIYYGEGYLQENGGWWATDNVYRYQNPTVPGTAVYYREVYTMSTRTITVWDVAARKKTQSVLTLGDEAVCSSDLSRTRCTGSGRSSMRDSATRSRQWAAQPAPICS